MKSVSAVTHSKAAIHSLQESLWFTLEMGTVQPYWSPCLHYVPFWNSTKLLLEHFCYLSNSHSKTNWV